MRQGLNFREEPFEEYFEFDDEFPSPLSEGEDWEAPFAGGSTVRIQDCTDLTPKSKRIRKRDPKTVNALVMHQMAFSRGNNPAKYTNVTAHYAILPDGKILQLHPVSAYLYSSNGFNRQSVAVEFAGNLPDIRGKWWSPQTHGRNHLTPQQIEAGRYLVKHLVKEIGLKQVLAHRQASASRENCPGPDIWYHVGQWAVNNLGLSDGGPNYKIDKGNPIPLAWRNWGNRTMAPQGEVDDYVTEDFEDLFELNEEIEEEQSKVKKTGKGYRGSGGGRLDQCLRKLRDSGKLSISDADIDMLQRIANVESGGLVQAINSYDSAFMSMGFMQWTIAFDSLQRLISRAPATFRKYGIELDGTRRYNIPYGRKPLTPIAIKGAQQPSELRSLDWAKRFYAAGLDPDILVVEAKLALVVLQEARQRIIRKVGSDFLPYYSRSAALRALIHETFNNRPAYVRFILERAIERSKRMGDVGTDQFLELVRQATKEVYGEKEPKNGPQKALNLISRTSKGSRTDAVNNEAYSEFVPDISSSYEVFGEFAYS